jgi:hypothetical protein
LAFSQKAFVVDERLAALRKAADLKSQVLRRLRPPRPVYLIDASGGAHGRPKFYRVAVTRRTRGWIHEAAIAIPGRANEDARLMRRLAETRQEKEGLANFADRLVLGKLFIEQFPTSKLMPKALLWFGEDSYRLAAWLKGTAQRHLKNLDDEIRARDFYLSDPGLDRFSKLGVRFDYSEKTGEYVYDGQAYRDLIRRFPKSPEAALGRQALALMQQKLAQK